MMNVGYIQNIKEKALDVIAVNEDFIRLLCLRPGNRRASLSREGGIVCTQNPPATGYPFKFSFWKKCTMPL